ncbi:MAG TPA: M48 family metalloprotease [Candidatus Acidoferrum sp.]|nr:M48 family metalloprotease [Candidatus Acidoferrum sp.]
MRIRTFFPSISAIAAALFVASSAPAVAQEPTVAQVVDKIVAQEQAEIQILRGYSPLVETYIQLVRPDKDLGAVPDGDRYFLGRAALSKGVDLEPLITGPNGSGKAKVFSSLGSFFTSEFLPRGFLQMIYIDTDGFDSQHYKFTYAGREFVGEVRCLIFDVDPLPNSGKGRFAGRIWVEDQDYHIVRFNGAYGGSSRSSYYFNFDSWRVNTGKNEWLPAYIYSEEGNVEYGVARHSAFHAFKAQTRLWGYDMNQPQQAQTLSSISIDAPKINDQSKKGNGYSPLQARRAWGRLAEDNVAAKMQKLGLLAPYGDVDRILETVVNNLEVTNELDIQPDVRCRILMTSTLESFTLGHTIVVSRGLIDVLPDEASLAAVLAHELAHVTLGHRMDTEFAFFNRTRFDEKETFHHFGFARNTEEEEAANKKGIELLKKSPYQESGTAQAFFAALQSRVKEIPNLISPHLGDRVPKNWTISDAAVTAPGPTTAKPVSTKASSAAPAALPLGGRIKVEPWNGQLALLKPQAEGGTVAEYEKMPFEVGPFLVYLTREDAATSASASSASPIVKAEAASDTQPGLPEVGPNKP